MSHAEARVICDMENGFLPSFHSQVPSRLLTKDDKG